MIRSLIFFSNSALVVVLGKSITESNAKSLKKYLCSPSGGHGPPYSFFFQLFNPSVAPAGMIPYSIEFISGMFHMIQ